MVNIQSVPFHVFHPNHLYSSPGGGEDQPDIIYQVLKQATDLKRPSGAGGSVSSGSGSGNGFHGSSQTIYSQQTDPYGGAYACLSSNAGPGPSTQHRRSNPTVNVIGNSGTSHSGTSTPALAAAQAAAFHPSSSGKPNTCCPHSLIHGKANLSYPEFM